MDNLFINIQKYRPRVNNNPKENFFTEILAFILKQDKKLLEKFVRKLGFSDNIRNLTIETQVFHEGKMIDMEIKNKKISIFIENKLGSSVSETKYETENEVQIENQLVNYLKIQENRKGLEGYVVLLTQFNEIIREDIKNNKKFKGHIFWHNIYPLFYQYKPKNERIRFLINQFKGLMEDENMNPYQKISKDMIENYKLFLKRIRKLFENTFERTNFKITNRGANWDEIINYHFSFQNKGLCLAFSNNELKFYLYIKTPTLTKNEESKVIEKGYQGDKYLLWKEILIKDNFFSLDDEEQLKEFKTEFNNLVEELKEIL